MPRANSSLPSGRFAGTAAAYAKFRPAYPPDVIAAIAARCKLNGTGRALEIGCGPGLLTLPLSRLANEVVALDIDADMVEAARAETKRMNIGNIAYHVMGGEDISPALGSFDAVVFGNSFHWMDRLLVAHKLKALLSKGGRIAILTAFYLWHGDEQWKHIVRRTIHEFTGEDRSKGMGIEPSDMSVLADAGYGGIEEWDYEMPQTYSLPSLVGFLASTSYASHEKLGDRADEFERVLRQRLKGYAERDIYTETAKFTLITAKQV